MGLESTIVGMEGDQVTVFRLGGLTVDAIEEALGASVVLMQHSSSNPKSPGMLKSHYAPRKPFRVGELPALIQQAKEENLSFALLTFGKSFENIEFQHDLSPDKVYKEAAYHLFSAMRQLDEAPVDVILAELLPEEGLGRAINDRLRRAAADEKEG
ncbi:Sua5 family C-terminal domain-containing protein [Nitritalea halalkaliphila]|uniref:Sua5 family C-terminal domain-containing protein n=1 Tax=Nitritalea halalkaliphila TaxID=590849 RepID=UPI0029341E58|nr:Sua5 family C-terminal domain-containing protein [Nitritalea halalkaliphila]